MQAWSPWPQRTTFYVGILLIVDGALLLIEAIHPTLAVTNRMSISLSGTLVAFLAAISRAVAFILAATGVHGELGVAARSRAGRATLIVWGLRDLTYLLLDALAGDTSPPAELEVVGLVTQVLFPIAALTAAITIARARVLVGNVRWALLPLAAIEVLFSAMSNLPATAFTRSIAVALASLPTEFIEPILILLIAIALITWGRIEALKHRARITRNAW